jgi:hypothetical protein
MDTTFSRCPRCLCKTFQGVDDQGRAVCASFKRPVILDNSQSDGRSEQQTQSPTYRTYRSRRSF